MPIFKLLNKGKMPYNVFKKAKLKKKRQQTANQQNKKKRIYKRKTNNTKKRITKDELKIEKHLKNIEILLNFVK